MKKKNPLSIFNGKQGHMYAALLLLWQNYAQRQADFAKKNTKYTQELGDEQQQAIKDARDLPDVAVRRSIPKEARDTMNKAATGCTNHWQELSGLIESSYPQNQWDIKKALAGYASYTAASKGQWDAVITLTNAGINFINDNMDNLTVGGMLPEFPNSFAASQKRFTSLYEDYYNSKQDFNKQTSEKANANNAVYDTAIGLMSDAKKMYRNQPNERTEFTYSSLMKKVRGEGFTKTGCRFILLNAETSATITTATILVTGDNISKSQNATEKGIIRMELTAGTYQFTLTAPGFSTVFGSVMIKDGTMHQKTVRLEKAVVVEREENVASTDIVLEKSIL